VITGQPPFGAFPRGMATSPETATLLPFTPVLRYSTSSSAAAPFSRPAPLNARAQIRPPWLPLTSFAGAE